jgi:AcrR family transcriptional regulator
MVRIKKKVPVKPEKQAARERLLQSALDLFNKKGYASTSVREIVAAAGVTKPVLYYYFKSKEGIYLELMSRPFEFFEKILDETVQDSASARELVLRLFDRIFLLFVENHKAARLMYSIYYGPPQGAPFLDFEGYHLKIREVTGRLVREGIKSGEFREADPEVFMWALNGALNFVLEEQLCQRAPQIDRIGLSRILNLIFDGLTKAKSKKKR